MLSVKFGDLAREYRSIRSEIEAAIAGVLSRGWFVLGPEVEAFEREFAAYLGATYCVGVASGTEALALALMACGVGCGDEVITVAHTAVPTVSAISLVGGLPVFVDILPETCLMDVRCVEVAITPRTRAIVPVHLYGQCVDMAALLEVAGRHAIPVVEDAAQAHGAIDRGRKAGTIGLMGCFSFYPSKNLGCYGDGGAVVTSDPELYEKLTMLRNYGQSDRYHHKIKGLNSRLDELQAAILLVKLRYLDEWNRRRCSIAQKYDHGLQGLPLVTPVEAEGRHHIYHLYVIQTPHRNALHRFLHEQGIQTLVHYPVPVHRQEAYAELGYAHGSLPVTERLADEVLSLPVYPQLGDDEVHAVIEAVRRFFHNGANVRCPPSLS